MTTIHRFDEHAQDIADLLSIVQDLADMKQLQGLVIAALDTSGNVHALKAINERADAYTLAGALAYQQREIFNEIDDQCFLGDL